MALEGGFPETNRFVTVSFRVAVTKLSVLTLPDMRVAPFPLSSNLESNLYHITKDP